MLNINNPLVHWLELNVIRYYNFLLHNGFLLRQKTQKYMLMLTIL